VKLFSDFLLKKNLVRQMIWSQFLYLYVNGRIEMVLLRFQLFDMRKDDQLFRCWMGNVAVVVVVMLFNLVPDVTAQLSHLRFYRWGIDCCRCHFVVVPMMILVTMAGNQGTRMYAPNLDDRYDPCACTIQLHPHPISLQQIPAMWWTIASKLPAIKRLVVPHIRCYFPDSKLYPKRWMLLRSHVISMWYELDAFDVKCVSQFRRNHLQTLKLHAGVENQMVVMMQISRHTFQKNQCQKIVMNWLNLVMFCDLNHLVEMPYRDLFCGG